MKYLQLSAGGSIKHRIGPACLRIDYYGLVSHCTRALALWEYVWNTQDEQDEDRNGRRSVSVNLRSIHLPLWERQSRLKKSLIPWEKKKRDQTTGFRHVRHIFPEESAQYMTQREPNTFKKLLLCIQARRGLEDEHIDVNVFSSPRLKTGDKLGLSGRGTLGICRLILD